MLKTDLPKDLDPTSVGDLKRAFRVLRKPSNFKKFGQNFLVDPSVRDKILQAAELSSQDTVLEVGPGSGVLTEQLVKQASRVVALDVDPYTLEIVKHITGEPDNLELFLQDIKTINLPEMFCPGGKAGEYIVVSNPPYLLTGYLFRLFLEGPCSPKRLVLMIQEEVADRVLAAPGQWSLLTVSVALFGSVKKITDVSARAFWPKPNVSSTVIRIDRHAQPIVPLDQQKKFLRVVKAGFSAKRKTLKNALAGGLHLTAGEASELLREAKIDTEARAQELQLENWTELSQKYEKLFGNRA